MSTPAIARTARDRARQEITGEVLDTARRHLARDGAIALSLRAVARDLGMSSSAVYRYVPTRDALLTLLIIDAYTSLGAAAEKAERSVPRPERLDRFLAIANAVRTWALNHPHEYALIFGSPVPGYDAPAATAAPAARIPTLLLAILDDWAITHPHTPIPTAEPAITATIAPLRETTGTALADDLLLRGLCAWSALFGTVSLEVFGHTHNVVAEGTKPRRTYFDHQMRTLAESLHLV
jgi:AcrR family transcriptional regulator